MKKSRIYALVSIGLLLCAMRYCMGSQHEIAYQFCPEATSYKLTIAPPLLGRSISESNPSLTAFDFQAHGAELGCLERADDDVLLACQSYGMEKSQPLNGTWQLEREFYFNQPYGLQGIASSGLYSLIFTNGPRRLALSETDLTLVDENWARIFRQNDSVDDLQQKACAFFRQSAQKR